MKCLYSVRKSNYWLVLVHGEVSLAHTVETEMSLDRRENVTLILLQIGVFFVIFLFSLSTS